MSKNLESKAQKFFNNLVTYNLEIINQLDEAINKLESRKKENPMISNILFLYVGGVNQCLIKIKEAVKIYRFLFEENLEVPEDIMERCKDINDLFYYEGDTVYHVNGQPADELLEMLIKELGVINIPSNEDE